MRQAALYVVNEIDDGIDSPVLARMSTESQFPLERREETSEDSAFLRKLFVATKGVDFSGPGWDPLESESLLAWQFTAREQAYRQQIPPAQHLILIHKGEPIGRLVLRAGFAYLDIVDIAVLPGFQRKGVGTQVLKGVIEDAFQRRVAVRLRVENRNPARRLYERLGFRELSSDGVYTSMEFAVTLTAWNSLSH